MSAPTTSESTQDAAALMAVRSSVLLDPEFMASKLYELALFAGAGGGILGGKLCGFRTVCAVEWDAHARDVLRARQDDGCLEPFPIWDDVQTFDGKPWAGLVDVVSGGFPCQDISSAGSGAGIEGERSGMWSHMARIVGEVLPRYVLVENSPLLVGRGLVRVLGDLAAMGYDARWGVVGACHAGAPHQRERIWIVADNPMLRPARAGEEPDERTSGSARTKRGHWWDTEPDVGRVVDGLADGVDERIHCIGNGQVPGVAAMAWRILSMHNNSITGG